MPKLDRVSPLMSFNNKKKKSKSALEFKVSPIKFLSKTFNDTRRFIKESNSQSEVFDALINMDACLKVFRNTYYPYFDSLKRLDYEEYIHDMVNKLESYARRKLKRLKGERILSF